MDYFGRRAAQGSFWWFKKRYPNRNIIPFAHREDNDDVACWDKNSRHQVIIIHDFASEGYEYVGKFDSFWDWL
ncbi:hypothetical protein ACFYLI_19220, partial [Proteus mirabilis]